MEAYAAREPVGEERLEIAIARLIQVVVMLGSSGPKPKVTDFLPYLKAWDEEAPEDPSGRYSGVDLEVLQALGGAKR